MFVTRKTKIVSAPAEEVLEVEDPFIEEIKNVVIPQQVSNIEFLTVEDEKDDIYHGTLTDYDGNLYHYWWDNKPKRIKTLLGKEVNPLTWNLCDIVLQKYFAKPKKEKAKKTESLSEQVEKALKPVHEMMKSVDGKVEKLLSKPAVAVPTVSYSAPVQQTTQRPAPTTVTASTQVDTPAINVADDEISINAQRFLQQSNTEDLGIDYMSL